MWTKSTCRIFDILKNYFTGGDLQHNVHRVLFATRTWQIDPLWLTLCSYFVSVLGFDTLLIWLNNTRGCSHFLLGNTKNCQFTLSNNVFSFKMVHVQIFSWRTPAKVRSNLKIILLTVKCLKTGAVLVNFSILDVMQLYLFLKIHCKFLNSKHIQILYENFVFKVYFPVYPQTIKTVYQDKIFLQQSS